MIAEQSEQARQEFEATGEPARVFADFGIGRCDSWSRERRVVGQGRAPGQGSQPAVRGHVAVRRRRDRRRPLYEEDYCGRGEMENRIKEQQLHLFADRTSCGTMRANQFRLFFSSIAYVLLECVAAAGAGGDGAGRVRSARRSG